MRYFQRLHPILTPSEEYNAYIKPKLSEKEKEKVVIQRNTNGKLIGWQVG